MRKHVYKDLSEAEMMILKLLWKENRKMSAVQIVEHFPEKEWKMTTVSTFLSRMIEKKVVRSEREGRNFFYYPTVTPAELKKRKAWSFLSENFSSVKDFVLALGDERITSEEAEEIDRILSKIEDEI